MNKRQEVNKQMEEDMKRFRGEFDAICISYKMSEDDYNQLVTLARWI